MKREVSKSFELVSSLWVKQVEAGQTQLAAAVAADDVRTCLSAQQCESQLQLLKRN